MPRTKKTTEEKETKTKKVKPESKAEEKEKEKKEGAEKEKQPTGKYIEAVGRRKTAVARVRLFSTGEKKVIINEKELSNYFPMPEIQQVVLSPLEKVNMMGKFLVSVKVRGGGFSAQAEAIRHGLARALVKVNPNFKKRLKKAGYLTRDPRMRERKKFGLKRARRAPQWQKR